MTKNNQKKKIITGLKKARTSLDKIIQELEKLEKSEHDSEKKCFNVIQQNLSVVGLLKSANIAMLKNQLDFYMDNINNKKMSQKKLQNIKDQIVHVVKVAQDK
jgi:DNA-binding FrmR family transcriptional regulator